MADKLQSDCRVTLTTRNGSTFTGLLHTIDEVSGKIVLKSVTTAGSKLCGPQNFYRSDLINLQLLNSSDDISNKKKTVTDKRGCLGVNASVTMKTEQHNLQNLENINSNNLAMESKCGEDSGDQGFGSGEDVSVADSNNYYEKDGYILICGICDKLYEAIVYIMEQHVVGVAFKGVNIGRDGTLSLIQVVTETKIFIFDILRLGKQAFVEGLQALFEANKIVKVIHDCRWISDMLHEKYNIYLANVFDTQVANAFVYKVMNGDWPQYVESLPGCLNKHLNLQVGKVNFNIKEDPSVWLQRPLSLNLLSAGNINVSYLIQLYQALLNKLLYEFRIGVEIYLNQGKMMNGQMKSWKINGRQLPYSFWEIPKLAKSTFADRRRDHAHTNHVKHYQDKQFNISNHQIMFSQDSMWYRSKGSGIYGGTDKHAERGIPTGSSDYWKNNDNNNNKNSKFDPRGSNIMVSEKSNFKLSKDILQDRLSRLNENCSVNNQGQNSLLSQLKEANSSSKTVTNSSHQEFRVVENVLENKNNSGFLVPTYTDKSRYASSTVELEQINKFPEKLLATHISTRVGQPAEHVFAAEVNHVPSVKSASVSHEPSVKSASVSHVASVKSASVSHEPSVKSASVSHEPSVKFASVSLKPSVKSASVSHEPSVKSASVSHEPSVKSASVRHNTICRSKLWQAVHAKQSDTSPELLCELNAPEASSNQHEIHTISSNELDTMQKKESDKIQIGEAFQKLADLHFPEKIPIRISSSDNFEFDTTPETQLLDRSSNLSSSFSYDCLSNDTDDSFAPHVPRENVHETELDNFSFLPAGYMRGNLSKRKIRDLPEKHKSSDKEFDEATYPRTLPLEDELGCIPMQDSLRGRLHELPLGATFGIGDPFSQIEDSIQQSKNLQSFIEPHLALNDDPADEDTEKENTFHLKILQKALKMSSILSSDNLLQKLLPPKTSGSRSN